MKGDRRIAPEGTAAEYAALLRLVTRCVGCGGIAEVTLAGRPRCVACAAPHRRGQCTPLPHAALALRIEDALSPFVPGTRSRG